MSRQGFGPARHLVRRFAGSLRPGGPSGAEESWATSWLTDGEQALWRRMSGPDRRHAVAVARRVSSDRSSRTDGQADRAVLAAALLHDVGKVESGLGTWGRVVTTAASMLIGRVRVARASAPAGRYLGHDVLGADLLQAAGSDPLTVAWAREHHLAPDRWSVPAAVGAALKSADND